MQDFSLKSFKPGKKHDTSNCSIQIYLNVLFKQQRTRGKRAHLQKYSLGLVSNSIDYNTPVFMYLAAVNYQDCITDSLWAVHLAI